MGDADFYDRIAQSTDAQILSCDSFLQRHSAEHRAFKTVFRGAAPALGPDAGSAKLAQKGTTRKVIAQLTDAKKRILDAKSRQEAVELLEDVPTMSHLLCQLVPNSNSRVVADLFKKLSEMGSRTWDDGARAETWEALCANPYFWNHFRMHVCVICSYAGAWRDKSLNISPSVDRDDSVDTMLPMYAQQGDIILTDDRMLRRWVDFVFREDGILAMTWDELRRDNREIGSVFPLK